MVEPSLLDKGTGQDATYAYSAEREQVFWLNVNT
jgi:hypothetical protein